MKKKSFTVSIYTENNIGLLNRITGVFLKRRINIESITVSQSELNDIMRYIIVIDSTADKMPNLISQIEKQIEVFKAFFHTDEEMILQETALYKIRTSTFFDSMDLQEFIKETNARIVTATADYFVIEKMGKRKDTAAVYEKLKPYGLMQFVRSGTIAISKNEMQISKMLENFNTQNTAL